MPDVSYYKKWLLDCSRGVVPEIEPAILERAPWGEHSAMDRLYDSLLMEERVKFVQAMKEIVGEYEAPVRAKMLMIDFAWPRSIWDIEPEVKSLDQTLAQEPWHYDALKPPQEDERLQIDLRGLVNKFLLVRERVRKAYA
jgi:hypothetical protein